jgi:acetyl-CoA C-acetyltransferase
MRDVVIIGVGQTRVDEHWDRSLRHLAHDAIMAAMLDADIETADALYVGNMLSGELSGQEHLGALVADFIGLRGIEAMKVEAACASGAAALRVGMMAVASGIHEVVMVCGVEKMTDAISDVVTSGLAMAADQEYEVSQGVSFVGLNALLMRRYMHQYGVKHEHFAGFAVNAHKNGANNPNAMFQSPIKAETYLKAGMIADPINLMDSSPVCDGAACLILAPAEHYRSKAKAHILASAVATDSLAIHDRRDPLTWMPSPSPVRRRTRRRALPRRTSTCSRCTTRSRSWPRSRSRPQALRRRAGAYVWPWTARLASAATSRSAPWVA